MAKTRRQKRVSKELADLSRLLLKLTAVLQRQSIRQLGAPSYRLEVALDHERRKVARRLLERASEPPRRPWHTS